jgi:hypothetical protein
MNQQNSQCLSAGSRERYLYIDPLFRSLLIPFRYNPPQSVIAPIWWDESVKDINAESAGYWPGAGNGCVRLNVTGYKTRYQYLFHGHRDNYQMNHVGGIFHGEYVEGGSIMTSTFWRSSWRLNAKGWRTGNSNPDENFDTEVFNIVPRAYSDSSFVDGCGGVAYKRKDYFKTTTYTSGAWADFTCWAPYNMKYNIYKPGTTYISPVYSEMLNARDSSACYIALDATDPITGQYYHSQNISMDYTDGLVFRSDRLPSSDRPNGYEELEGSGFLIHQNPGFRMFLVSFADTTVCPPFSGFGGGSVATNAVTNDPDNTLVSNANINDDVLKSTVDCSKAVDLNSYTIVTPVGSSSPEPAILPRGPWSKDGKYLWFQRNEGCYNTVSRPILSMLTESYSDPNTGQTKKYSDIISVVEWVQRIKLTMAACFDIFSHTFSNNWVNGTLYAFPFQLATRYDVNNLPTERKYCKDVL